MVEIYVLKAHGMFVSNRKSPVNLSADLSEAEEFTKEEATLLMKFSSMDLEMIKL